MPGNGPGDTSIPQAASPLSADQLLQRIDAAMLALEDLESQLVLQSGDLVADGALGQIELAGGRGEAQMAGYHIENPKVVVGPEAHRDCLN